MKKRETLGRYEKSANGVESANQKLLWFQKIEEKFATELCK